MDQNHTKLKKIKRSKFEAIWGYFLIFEIYGGNHNTRVNPWKPKAADTI
jgi:hypothetical protein